MKRLTFLLFCLLLGIGMANAQTSKVTGTVISAEDNEPIIGASIVVKGTTIGTVTDFNGTFSLDVPSSAKTLVISFVGMKALEIGVKPVLHIELSSDVELLDEVVVTGYGNFKKSSFTGAASSVTTEKLQDVPSLSVQSKLAGAVSGVQITSTSGQPGAVESVRIRGMGSINASNDPLYVIDGVPMMTGNSNGFSYDDAGTSMLSNLNSNDIESMTVIKDAAAASLYGSRAANGVIVITTKKGMAGKTKFTARADWGFSNMAIDYRPILNGADRRDILYMGFKNYGLNSGMDETAATSLADRNIDSYAAEPWSGYTNWKDVLFRNGSHQNYEVNAQGGNDKTKFYSSLSYAKQDGITLQSAYERVTGRANLTHKTGRITLEANSLYSLSTQDVNNEGTSFASPIMCLAMTASPSTFPYNEDGTWSTKFPALNGANPLQTATYNYNKNKVNRFLGSVAATWNIWDNLNVKEVLSYDFNQSNSRAWWDPRSNDGRTAKGVYQRYMQNRSKFNTQTQLTYNKTIAEKHNLDILLGYETEDYELDYTYSNGSQYPSYKEEIANAGLTRSSSLKKGYRMVSYLGRLNYDFDSRYYASASYRRDGSSRLSRDSRWGDFWSVSGSWRLSREAFMESLSDIISDAKIRVSYGLNGTQPSDYYAYMGLFQYGYNYNGFGGSAESTFFNNDLKWEKNHATNVGLDVTLFNRVSISAEWYNRDTKDLIMDKPISAALGIIDGNGTASKLLNVGSMRNRGFELEIKSTNVQNGELTWTTSLNLGHNKNTLTKLNGEQDQVISGPLIHKVGEPYYSFYAYEYAGVDSETGKELYYINKDGSRETTTNSALANKVIIGNVDPKVQGGLTNYIGWKFIDFNFTLTYALGGHAYDYATWLQSNGGTYNYLGNVPSYYKMEDTWQKPGDNAKLPQFAYGNKNIQSSRWMMSTNHLRLKNMTVGFTLPQNWIRKAGIEKLRAYISGNNLLTWKSKDLYVDPEVPVDGLCTFETPSLRTVTFGIELGF